MHGAHPERLAAVTVEVATPAHLRLLLDDVAGFESAYGLRVVPGYLEFDGALAAALAALEDGMPARWWTHLFIHAGDRALIGLGGYTGPPENGTVEIGYGIAPDYRGRGLATAAAAELVARAGAAGIRTVQAHTLAHANASTGVLTVLGFTRTGELDSEDGPLWRWELRLPAEDAAPTALRPDPAAR
jgi:ribosomal-protein-alanine N-acetyltransferase